MGIEPDNDPSHIAYRRSTRAKVLLYTPPYSRDTERQSGSPA